MTAEDRSSSTAGVNQVQVGGIGLNFALAPFCARPEHSWSRNPDFETAEIAVKAAHGAPGASTRTPTTHRARSTG